MRCPYCNRFVGMEPQDPEANLEVEYEDCKLVITGDVRCALECAECSSELKEATFDVNEEVDAPEGHDHEPNLEVSGEEATESGGGRYKKNLRGFRLDYTITCKCGMEVKGEIHDELQASAWDELV